MQKKKLLKLADFLDKLPRKKFDMSSFIIKPNDGCNKISLKCKATACAFGWCPVVFPKSGFSIKVYDKRDKSDTVVYDVVYKNKTNCHAAALFFNITFDESMDLFIPTHIVEGETPKQAAKRIRQFVKSDGL